MNEEIYRRTDETLSDFKLFMVLLGCRPAGRNTEQHDVFFGVAKEIRELVPQLKSFWKGSGNMHVDGWRIVENVDGHQISVSEKRSENTLREKKLFFLNLGGYKEKVFDEFHYKMLTVATSQPDAVITGKSTAFFKHTGFNTAPAHVDDKYGVDVDDIFEVKEILPEEFRTRFSIQITSMADLPEDKITLGFFRLHEL